MRTTILSGVVMGLLFVASAAYGQTPNPYACKGQTKHYPSGNLEVCTLATAQVVSNLMLPANTVTCFNDDKTLRFFFLEKPTMLNGYMCKGKGHNWMQTIYPNGKPKLMWLEHDEVINGIPCMSASFMGDVFGGSAGVHFYENGNVAQCKLSKDFTYKGTAFKKGDKLHLDQSGNIIHQ